MSKRKTHEQFINELKHINPKIEVLGQYITALTKIQVKCTICGKLWDATPSALLNKNGCPDCGIKKIGNALRKSDETFISELQIINENIKPLEKYKGNKKKILLQCKICGNEWRTTPHILLSGHGCPKCGYEKQKEAQKYSHEKFMRNLMKVNSNINVLDKYINNHTKIRFQCKSCGRIWKTVPNSVLSGHGCPDCARSSTSFLEQVILQSFSLILGKDAVISRDRNLIGMELDIVIPSLKVAYEPGSWAWHYNKKARDTKKREKCSAIGYQLITIFTDYKLDQAPFDSNCYTTTNNLGNSNWDETKCLVQKLLHNHNLSLLEDQWDTIRYTAITKSKKQTNEEYTKALYAVNPKIEAISKYLDSSTKVKYRCLICMNTWEALPGSVLSGHGCPNCGRQRTTDSKRKSHKQFILEMKNINPNITIVGEYVDTKTKILCECCDCGNIWEMRPQSLLKGQGCPKCGRLRATEKNRKTNSQFIEELSIKNPNLIVKGQYINSSTKIEVECKKCGYIWLANPTTILNNHGCPKCARTLKKTHEQFINELKQKFPYIQPLDNYCSANKKINVKCNNCNYIWEIRPHDLLRSKGCPYCRKIKNSKPN